MKIEKKIEKKKKGKKKREKEREKRWWIKYKKSKNYIRKPPRYNQKQ